MAGPIITVGKYQILERVGEGAMGVVYRAIDPVLNRTVAIKVMSEGLAQDEGLRARFLREAQAAGSLQHPNVVTIYDFGETDGHLFIAMEFIEGADLRDLLKHHSPLTLAAKLDIIIDVLNGLSYAHRHGIVHRDIKPANIRIDEEGRARIMDFGVARLASSELTRSGVLMGTPDYMAPEQIIGDMLTPAVDLFSVGAMFYELLTHVKPFQGATIQSVLFKIVGESPPELREVRPDLPPALNDIVSKALAKDPKDRYHAALQMAEALSVVRATLGPQRVTKTISQRIEIDKGLRERQAGQERAARRWRTIAASAGTLLVIVTIGYFVREQTLARRSSEPVSRGGPTLAGSADSASGPRAVVPDSAPRGAPRGAGLPARPLVAQREIPRSTPPVAAPRETRSLRTTTAAADSAISPNRVEDSVRVAQSVTSQPATTTPSVAARDSATQAAAPIVQAAPPGAPPGAPPATVPVPDNPRPAISSVIDEYARAIGTREIAEVRRVYAGMTPQQQAGWDSFFSSVRLVTAAFDIVSLDVNGNRATVHLTGVYEYVSRFGRTERQPISVQATLRRDGDRWTLETVR